MDIEQEMNEIKLILDKYNNKYWCAVKKQDKEEALYWLYKCRFFEGELNILESLRLESAFKNQ